MKNFYQKLLTAVEESLLDLAPATAYAGESATENMAFVRRYLMDTGRYVTNPGANDGIAVAHESQADTELRTIRFDRGEEKDVLMVNYQTHYHGTFATQVSADFVHPLREKVEKELDVHFAYHNGASGNLNFQSHIKGEKKYKTLESAAHGIADVVLDAVSKEEKANLDTLYHEASYYDAHGKEVRLYAFTIGDIGFVSAPYEMFDTNGKQIREASPCKMTFVCAYTNGHMGYCPSKEAFPHGAYEVEASSFRQGDAENFAEELVRL